MPRQPFSLVSCENLILGYSPSQPILTIEIAGNNLGKGAIDTHWSSIIQVESHGPKIDKS